VEARFLAQVQASPEAYPSSWTMGTGYFPGVKRPGRGADHPPLLAPRSRKSRAIPLPPSGVLSLLRGDLYLYLNSEMLIPVAVRSKAWVCSRLITRNAGSNPTGGMDVRLLSLHMFYG
jgi:hypothetical protein